MRRLKQSREEAVRNALISLSDAAERAKKYADLLADLMNHPEDFHVEEAIRRGYQSLGVGSAVLRVMYKMGAEATLKAIVDGDEQELLRIPGIGGATASRMVEANSRDIAAEILARKVAFEQATQ